MKLLITTVLVTAMVLTPVSTGEWAVERGDVRRSGTSSDILIPPLMISETENGDKFHRNLKGEEGDITNCTPVIYDGKLVVGTKNGWLYAVNTNNFSDIIWKKKTENPSGKEVYRSSACIDGNRVYTGDRLGNVTCRNLQDGEIIWNENFEDWVTCSPLITVDNKLLIGTNEGYVYSLNKKTGKPFSNGISDRLVGPIYGITTTGEDDDMVFVGCGGDKKTDYSDYTSNLYCINTVNLKKQRWDKPVSTNGSILANPAVSGDGNLIFVTSSKIKNIENEGSISKSYLSCFSTTENGYRYWHTEEGFNNEMWTSPAVSGDYVVTSWKDGFVRSFNVDTGELEKSVVVFGNSSPVISGDYCYVGDTNGNIHVIDYKNGIDKQNFDLEKAWGGTEPYSNAPASSMIISGGYLYYVNTLCHLFKLEPAPKGKITIKESSVATTTIDPFSFEIKLENTRGKEESSHTNLELQLECKELNWESKLITLEPEESKIVVLRGVGNQFPGKGEYDLGLALKISNAHELEITWGDDDPVIWEKSYDLVKNGTINEKNLPLKNKILALTIDDPDPCLEVESFVDLGEVWDDQVAKKVYNIKLSNPCQGILSMKVNPEDGIIIEGKDEFVIGGNSDDSFLFRLDNSITNKHGNYNFKIFLNGERIDEQIITVQFAVKLSESIVVVQIGSTRATINGIESILDAPPYITQGTTMVPLRFVSEGLGFDKPEWIADIKTIIIHLGNERYLRLVLGYPKAIIEEPDGSLVKKDLTVAPEIKNGRTFIPLRFIGDTIGAEVAWNGDTKEVTLTRSLKLE